MEGTTSGGGKIVVMRLPAVSNVCRQVLREVWKSPEISIAHVIMPPGNVSLLHKHETFTELYYILSGRGMLLRGREEISVRGGMVVVVPPGTPHKLKNVGKSSLKHLVISSPQFNPKDVVILEGG